MANDRTAEYVIKLIGRDEDLRRKVQGAIADMQKMGKEAGVLTRANGAIMSSLGGIAAAGAAAFTVKAMMDYTREAANLAATGEGIRAAFAKLNQPGLLDELKKATRGTASEMKLMQTAIQAQNFKIPLTQLATYLKFATNRALETGQSVDYLVESIITGIGRQSPLILDNLGLSAKEISNEFQRTGDFGKAVGTIIQTELSKAGDVADTAAVKIQRHAATVENMKEAWGRAVNELGLWQSVIDGVTVSLDKSATIMAAKTLPAWTRFIGLLKSGIGIDDVYKEAQNALAEQELIEAAAAGRAKERRAKENEREIAQLEALLQQKLKLNDAASKKEAEELKRQIDEKKSQQTLFQNWTIKELEKARATQARIGDAKALEDIALIDAEITRRRTAAEEAKKGGEVKRRSLAEVNAELQEALKLQGEVNVYDRAAVAEINKKVGALTAEKEAYEKLFAVREPRTDKNLAPMQTRLQIKGVDFSGKEWQQKAPKLDMKGSAMLSQENIQSMVKGLDVITQKSLLYGKAIDSIKEKKELVQQTIDGLLENGYKAESTEIQGLVAMLQEYDALQLSITGNAEMVREAMAQLGGSFEMMGSAIGGAAGNWLGLAGAMLEQIPALIAQIQALAATQTAASAAAVAGSSSEVAASLTNAGAKQVETTAAISAGAAKKLPFPASLIAVALIIGTMISLFAKAKAAASPKKFAAGGIISGPTLGLMGEYPGASNNPEVVAPLDKLKGMIGERSGAHITIDEIVLTGDKIRIVQKVAERRLGRYN